VTAESLAAMTDGFERSALDVPATFIVSAGMGERHCPGDVDGDGVVGFGDLLQMLTEWGAYDDCPPYKAADIDEDCDVDFNDVLIALAAWGPCP
jgi:hypothetical protein